MSLYQTIGAVMLGAATLATLTVFFLMFFGWASETFVVKNGSRFINITLLVIAFTAIGVLLLTCD